MTTPVLATSSEYRQVTPQAAPKILVDGRWRGPHGIGRFASEVIPRLNGVSLLKGGPSLLHPFEPLWLTARILRERPDVYFTPGFNPPLHSHSPFVFMIYDLIHLHVPEESSWAKGCYYNLHLKTAAKRAFKILTVSEYSRNAILDWAHLPADRVAVAGVGVSRSFEPTGARHDPGFQYLLYVGAHKPHKNIPRMIEAFCKASIPANIRLVLTGRPSSETARAAAAAGGRVVLVGVVPETDLPMFYRGAIALLFPSLYEGFGLPAVEAMACGTPVITSYVTSLPEVAGRAAIYVDPKDTEAISKAVELIVTEAALAAVLKERGLDRARQFCWDRVAGKVHQVLVEAQTNNAQAARS